MQGPVIVLPDPADSTAFREWLPGARGRFIAIDLAQPTCRPDRQWEEYGATGAGPAVGDTMGSFRRMQRERQAAQRA